MKRRPTVAILIANRELAADLSQSLAKQGVDVFAADSFEKFYQLLNTRPVELVVLSHQLNEFLSGLDVLVNLHGDLLRPNILFLAAPGLVSPELANRFGIREILPADSPVGLLQEQILNWLAKSQGRQLVIPAEARRLVQKLEFIEPLPAWLVQISGNLETETISVPELAGEISADPVASAEFLRIFNSGLLGSPAALESVPDAVQTAGVRKTVSLLCSSSLVRAQGQLARGLPDAVRNWHNGRTLLIASAAATFADLDEVQPEIAFLLGLLQDLGISVLAQTYARKYQQMLQRIKEIGLLRLEVLELQNYGISHADVSAAIAQKWGLPHWLVAIVLNHHTVDAPADLIEKGYWHAMQIAEAMANLSDRVTVPGHQILTQLLSAYGDGKSAESHIRLADAVEKTDESKKIFFAGSTSPKSEPDLGIAAGGGPSAILVIDDDTAVAKLVGMILRSLKIEVLSCDNLIDAKRLFHRAALILCDVHLGMENGLDIAREVKQSGFSRPMIMISSDRTRDTIEECLAAGICDYLLKPFTRASLIEKLQKHISLEAMTVVNVQ